MEKSLHRFLNAAESQRRILHLRTVVGKGGGPEKTLLRSHLHLDERYRVRLAYLHPHRDPEFDIPQRAVENGADAVCIAERGPLDPRAIATLNREIRSFHPHVLHAHDYKTDLLAVFLGRRHRIPAVTTLHGNVTLGGKLRFYYRLDNWALRRMQAVIGVSRDLISHAADVGVPQERCVLIENGIDVDCYRRVADSKSAKAFLGAPPETFVVGAVGRLMPEKGFDILILAAATLLGQGKRFCVMIAGEGRERAELQRLINELGASAQIKLIGHCPDVARFFEACDLFVLSSRREASPNVVLEAMAMEVPVVATAVAGVPDILASRENGVLVPPDDVLALAAAIGDMLDDAEARRRLAAQGRRRVECCYRFEDRMRKEQAVYDRLFAELGAG